MDLQDTNALFVKAAELTQRITWVKDYRQKWLLIRLYCQQALELQERQKRGDREAHDQLVSMEMTAQIKVDKLGAWLLEHEPQLSILMKEIDPDVRES